MLNIKLDNKNFVSAHLQNNRKQLNLLIDSGASKTLISKTFVDNYMRNIAKEAIQPIVFRVGNGGCLISLQKVKVDLVIQNVKICFHAHVVENLIGVEVVLGTDVLTELGGSLDFETKRVKFKNKTVVLYPVKEYVIRPKQTTHIVLRGNFPKPIHNSEIVVNVKGKLRHLTASNLLVRAKRGSIVVRVVNRTHHTVKLENFRPLAVANTSDLVAIATPLQTSAEYSMHFNSTEFPDGLTEMEEYNLRKYPHLKEGDPITRLNENQAMRKQVNLKDSILTYHEQIEIYDMLDSNRNAFSLYGELSFVKNFDIDIQLDDDTPFYIRPYPTSAQDRKVIDDELTKLVKLGILKEGHTSYTSPVMLVPKKDSQEKRVVTDFRYLNKRVRKYNHPFPLFQETLKKLGNSNSKVLSVVDLKSAFFSLPLSRRAQQYTGIASYHGGKHFYYHRLPQGLSISPAIFQSKIDDILLSIPNSGSFCIAHHDDIIVYSKTKREHKAHLQSLFNALSNNGLKISPTKCKLFRQKVNYMGHCIFVNDDQQICVLPQENRCEAIRQMERPRNPKSVRRLIGAVNYVSQFFPGVQGVMRPLHKLGRKRKHFKWEQEHETAFVKLKEILTSPAVLHMPQSTGKFVLYSDTSRLATGGYVTQIVEGKEHLIGYYSKVLPSACQNYSVTELELFGLMVNIHAFKYLLRDCDFDVFVDHSALVQILTSKDEPCTNRVKKMLFKLSDYRFNVKYMKGTQLVLADCLSRAPKPDDSEFDIVKPLAFNVAVQNDDNFVDQLVMPVGESRRVTRAFAKQNEIEIPSLFPDREKRNETSEMSAHEASRSPDPPNGQHSDSSTSQSSRVPAVNSDTGETDITETIDVNNTNITDYDNTNVESTNRQSTSRSKNNMNRAPFELERNHSNEGKRKETNLRQNRPHLWSGNPKRSVAPETEPTLIDRLRRQVETQHVEIPEELYKRSQPIVPQIESLVTKQIPKQSELNKLMEVIKRKIIRNFNLPISCDTLKVEQETSPHFKPIYDYLAHDILPCDDKKARSVRLRSEEYIMCNGLLFRLLLVNKDQDFKLQLVIPESMIDTIITQFHDTILSSHQGVTRTFLTIRKHFYMPNMFQRISNYIKSCLRCQEFRGKPDKVRPFHCRVPDEYRPFDKMSIDFKTMPASYTGYKHIMVVCDEISRFVICVPLRTLDAETICETLIHRIIGIFGPPSCIISDAASSMTGKLVSLLCDSLQIDRKVISVENHGSLQVERHIQTIGNFLMKHLGQFGKDWVRFVSTTCYAYNTFSSPYLGNYCPYELALNKEPPNVTGYSVKNTEGLSKSAEDYVNHMKHRFANMGKVIISLQERHQEAQKLATAHKLNAMPIYSVGQLVYLYKPTSSSLTANSKKIAAHWCGPLSIYRVLDRTHYVLATLKGEVLTDVFSFNRIKPCFLRTDKQPVTSLHQLKDALNQSNSNESKIDQNVMNMIVDENGMHINDIEVSSMFCLQAEEISLSEYFSSKSVNKDLASILELSDDQMIQQLNIVMNAPNCEYFDIVRGQFKFGFLELLLKYKDQRGRVHDFWWKVNNDKFDVPIVTELVNNKPFPIKGSFMRWLRTLHA